MMPVYNAGDYLVDAIDSIRNQTITDFEFLIVDDCSTDDSWKILREYARKDKRIKIYRNEKRKGLVRSLNFLIPKTRGVYIARMDADDISLPLRFEKQVSYLEQNPNIVACGGQEYIIDDKGKIIAEKYFPCNPKACYNTLMNFIVIQPPLLMARGKVFRMFRYDNHIFRNDDITIHFKLLKKGDFGNVDEIIFKYRKLGNSLTHADPKRVFFLALKARINAIMNENYRPNISNLLFAFMEMLVVLLIPTSWIIPVFELWRNSKPKRDAVMTLYKCTS